MRNDRFQSMTELLRKLPAKENYAVDANGSHRSAVKIFAPHGGCIEPGTEAIVRAIARDRFDYFIFSGLRRHGCYATLHVTSTRYDEPQCLTLATSADVAVAVHGSVEKEELLHIGGGNAELAAALRDELCRLGYQAGEPSAGIRGEGSGNFVNRARHGGIQIELSAGFRARMFPTFPKTIQRNEEIFLRFVGAMKSWLAALDERLRKERGV